MLPQDLYYTNDHEWADVKADTATIGITDYAQQSLGEVTYVELPAMGKKVKARDVLAVVESSKAASDVYSPIAGAVAQVNSELESEPELVNHDCYNDGWICKIKISSPDDLKKLMDAKQYEEYLKTL